MKGIYLIEDLNNNKKYFGSSTKIGKRWASHLRMLVNNIHHCLELQESFNKSGVSQIRFSVIEVVKESKNLIEREAYYTSLYKESINRLPIYKEGNEGFKHKRSTIIQIVKSSNKYRPILSIDADGNKLDRFELIADAAIKYDIVPSTIYTTLINKKYTKGNKLGFIYEDEFGSVSLERHRAWNKGLKTKFKGKTREVTLYTLYGDKVTEFKSLHDCANYFNTSAANIHCKINKIPTKPIIDTLLSKYIICDLNTDLTHVKNNWDNIFSKFQNGNIKVVDCFGQFRGFSDKSTLSNALNIKVSSIYSAIHRGTNLKSLELSKIF